jgi:SAM-dependent methyltransferase
VCRGPEVPDVTAMFGQEYAGAYDAIYRNKDYEGEVDLIERILVRHGLDGPRRLLDLGCGTGNHALPLARRGHAVVGVDRSPAMLARARAKASAAPAACAVAFHQSDIRELDLGRRFDAVLMMFTVLGYQLEDADLTAALAAVRRHLDPGGLFVFDVWNGLAVLADRPGERRVSVTDGSTRITRNTQAELDIPRHLCRICFDLERMDGGGRIEKWREEHVMRYHFAQELELTLRQNQLDLVSLRSFPDDQAPADERAWNVVGVARAQ